MKKIEKQLGLKLPKAYRELLENYPAELRTMYWYDKEAISGIELLDNAKAIVEMNQYVRDPKFYMEDEDGEATSWPETYVVIGEDRCGDYYCVDVTKSNPAVLFWDHEECEFEKVVPKVSGYVKYLIKTFKEEQEAEEE